MQPPSCHTGHSTNPCFFVLLSNPPRRKTSQWNEQRKEPRLNEGSKPSLRSTDRRIESQRNAVTTQGKLPDTYPQHAVHAGWRPAGIPTIPVTQATEEQLPILAHMCRHCMCQQVPSSHHKEAPENYHTPKLPRSCAHLWASRVSCKMHAETCVVRLARIDHERRPAEAERTHRNAKHHLETLTGDLTSQAPTIILRRSIRVGAQTV